MIYDVNDPDIIESLCYLMVSKEEKLKTQALAFDGKRNCWIPEPRQGFIAAEIQSSKGEEITVKTCRAEVFNK
jgi:myosin heavy chain 6/7